MSPRSTRFVSQEMAWCWCVVWLMVRPALLICSHHRTFVETKKWIAALDDDSFERRQKAFKLLTKRGRAASDTLQSSLKTQLSRESRARIRTLLKHLEPEAKEQHQASVRDVAISTDSRTVATVGRKGDCKIWDAAQGRVIQNCFRVQHGAWSVTFSNNGRLLLVGAGDGSLIGWNLANREKAFETKVLTNVVHSIAVTSDGNYAMAAGGFDAEIAVMDMQGSVIVRRLIGNKDGALGIDVSCNDQYFAAVGYDGQLCVWSLKDFSVRKTVDIDSAMRCVAFSPDAGLIASGAKNGTVYVWRARDLKLVCSLDQHRGAVQSLAWGADGQHIYTAGDDGRVIVSDV